mgnify:CR=1 FL=1|jgi:lipopolysaccharide O-acetyltransferase
MKIKNVYSLGGYFKLMLCLLYTKIFVHKARIVRLPIDIRGKSHMDLGVNLTTGVGCRLEAFSDGRTKRIVFGSNVQINDYVHISAMEQVRIGNNVLMASHIYISDNSHGFYKGEEQSSPEEPPILRSYHVAPVEIGDNVWIGEGVVIMPGVTIGRGCIIGANSTVTKSIPPYCIAVGQPARVIKEYDFSINKWIPVK